MRIFLNIPTMLLMLLAMTGCFAAELVPVQLENDPVRIVGAYSTAKEWGGGYVVLGSAIAQTSTSKSYPVARKISKNVGWNDDFIVVDGQECIFAYSTPAPAPTYVIDIAPWPRPSNCWSFIVVATGQLYPDVLYDRFQALRRQFSIPDDLEMMSGAEAYNRLLKGDHSK